MQFLGEFLSPSNTIGLDEDKLTKYFYFRPDKYEDPTADLENIFIIKAMEQFPKRYDLLTENNLYAVDTIEVSKKISDDEMGIEAVSYIVTAHYDLLTNIKAREASSQPSEGDDSGEDDAPELDEDGNKITPETPPWKKPAKWGWQGTSVVVPFTKAYTAAGAKTIDVLNTAGDLLIAETEKNRIEITYSKSYQTIQSKFDSLLQPYVNSTAYNPPGMILKNRTFPAGTLKVLVPQYSIDYWEQTNEDGTTELVPYHTYNVTLVYDFDGWKKQLLNVRNKS
jgi:hypothetical protein